MSKKNLKRVLVFAKKPVPGRVKTRLIPAITAIQAAELHQQLVYKTLLTTSQNKQSVLELWVNSQAGDPFFVHAAKQFGAKRNLQRGNDLGLKMANAFQSTLCGCQKVVLVGADCPALTAEILQQAFQRLNKYPAVFAPTTDGGYALIGLRQFDPRLFQYIQWGTHRVMSQTRNQLRRMGWQWAELPMLWDVDRPEDLERLLQSDIKPVEGRWLAGQ